VSKLADEIREWALDATPSGRIRALHPRELREALARARNDVVVMSRVQPHEYRKARADEIAREIDGVLDPEPGGES
jgi:hypothetical protein